MADDDRTYLDYWFAEFFAPIGLPLIAGASVSTLIVAAVHFFLISSTSTSAAVCLATTALLMATWTLVVRFALVRTLPGLTCGAVLCFVATMSIGICLLYELNHQGAMPALAHSTFIALVGSLFWWRRWQGLVGIILALAPPILFLARGTSSAATGYNSWNLLPRWHSLPCFFGSSRRELGIGCST